MATQALYRKWRSQTFETVVGQEHVTLTLRNALREGRMSHAYLFTGPRGTGKTSTARIMAKAINCLNEVPADRPCNICSICIAISEGRLLDLIEIDAASNRGIDEIRDLREKIAFRPNEARYKVYIIDEVHMLTKEAFNALLKTLEEPPPHVVFILATTEPDRVPETVRSRCQRFDFRRIPTHEIAEHLRELVTHEGGKAQPEALVAIARRSTGSMRDSISLLDQLLSYGDETLTLERVADVLGLVGHGTIGMLVDHMAAGDTAAGLELLNRLVAEGVELGQLVDQVVAYLRGVMLVRVLQSPGLLDLPQDVQARMAEQAQRMSMQGLLSALKDWTEARGALRDQVPGVPQLPLEVAFLRSSNVLLGPAQVAAPTAPAMASQGPRVAEAIGRKPDSLPPAAGRTAESTRSTVSAGRPNRDIPEQATPSTATASQPSRPAQEPAPSSPAPADGLQERVNSNWDRFMALSRKQYGIKIQAALRNVKEVEVSGRTLVLHFAPAHGFSRDVINEPENKVHVEDAWRQVLGEEVSVRCTLAGAAAPASEGTAQRQGDAPTEGDALLADAKRRGAVITPLD